jgi:putative spermidine/putrescine transport system substrate-binding protein
MKPVMRLLRAAAAVACALSAASAMADDSALKGSGEVMILTTGGTWEAAQKKAYYEPFTKATGIKVVLVPFESAKTLVAIERGDVPPVDIEQLSAGKANIYARKNALEKMDYRYFDADTIKGMPAAHRQEHIVGQITYSLGIAYTDEAAKKSGRAPANWAEFFDAKKFPGARAVAACNANFIVDGGLLEMALMADGVPAAQLYPLDIDRAFRKLEAVRPTVSLYYTASGDGPQSLVDGRADYAATFNGRIYSVRQQGAKVNFEWNQSLIETHYWGVVKNAPNRENAMKFIAFASRAAQQAAASNLMAYGPANEAAFALIKPDLAPWLPGAPSHAAKQVRQNYAWWNEIGPDGKSNYERAVDRCNRFIAK